MIRHALTSTRIREEKPEILKNTNFKLNSTISAASKPNTVSFRRNVGSGSIKDLILFYEVTYAKNGSNAKFAKPPVTSQSAPIVIQKQTSVTCQQVESKASSNTNNNRNEVNSDASTFSSTNSSIASSLASSVASLANNDKTNISKREVDSNDDDDDESISQNENLEIIMSAKATQANINQYKHISNTSEIVSRPAFINNNNKRINSSSAKLLSEINAPAQKQNEDGEQLPMRVLNNNHENYVSSKMLNDNRGGGGEEERKTVERNFLGMLKQIYKSLLFIYVYIFNTKQKILSRFFSI